jgi:hypothetical protein
MPIANVELVMMASAAVLAAKHFPREVNDWEGLPSASHTWTAWKTAFRLAHVKRQQQILASGGGEPLGRAHGVIPVAAPAIGCLETALDSLALAATNNTAVLQQLIAANLALMATIMLLTSTNKNWLMRQLVGAVLRRRLLVGAGLRRQLQVGAGLRRRLWRRLQWVFVRQRNPALGTTAGLMAIARASTTQAQPAPTKLLATTTMQRPPTPLVAATRTRIGTRHAPDGVGWLTLFIAILMICAKTIITLLYSHLLAVIPPTFLLPTQALPTPVPVACTLHLTPQWQTSTQRLPPLVSA